LCEAIGKSASREGTKPISPEACQRIRFPRFFVIAAKARARQPMLSHTLKLLFT
jgi:hypothetical protein